MIKFNVKKQANIRVNPYSSYLDHYPGGYYGVSGCYFIGRMRIYTNGGLWFNLKDVLPDG